MVDSGLNEQIDATIGDEATNVIAGKENKQRIVTTTTTETQGSRAEANPQFFLGNDRGPYDAIMVAFTQQNGLLTRLETKFDSHITAVDTRFRALEKSYNMVEIAINAMQEKLRIMDKTSAELEHSSNVRGRQNETLLANFEDIRRQFGEYKAQMDSLKAEIAKGAEAKSIISDPRTIAGYTLLVFFFLGIAFAMGAGYYFMKGGG